MKDKYLGKQKSPEEIIKQLEKTRESLESLSEQIFDDYQLGQYERNEFPDMIKGAYNRFYSYYETDTGDELYRTLEKAIDAIDKQIAFIKDMEAAA